MNHESELDKEVKKLGITIASVLTKKPNEKYIKTIYPTSKRDAQKVIVGNPEWEETCFHYDVTLSFEGRKIETKFKCGFAHCQRRLLNGVGSWIEKPIPPSVSDVLHCLILDAEACESDFEDWCVNFGYDTDSRKALDLYMACQKSGKEIKKLLGSKFESLRNLEH